MSERLLLLYLYSYIIDYNVLIVLYLSTSKEKLQELLSPIF